MTLKTRTLFLALFLVFASAPLVAQEATETTEEISLPSAMNLEPNWWEYFQVTGPVYETHLSDLASAFSELEVNLEPEQKEKASPLIQKILVSAKALADLRAQAITPVTEKPFLTSYTIDQQIDLAVRLKSLQSKLKSDNKELTSSRISIQKIENHIDTLLASYLRMEKNTFPRLIAGLEIISTRFALALSEEKYRLLDAQVDQLKDQTDRLRKEVTYAASHLDLSNLKEEELDDQIANIREEVIQAEKNLFAAELATAHTLGTTPEEKLKASIFILSSIEANSMLAEKQVDLLILELKRLLAGLHHHPESVEQKEVQKKISELSKMVNDFTEQTNEWERKTRSMLEQQIPTDLPPDEREEFTRLQEQKFDQVQKLLDRLDDLSIKDYSAGLLVKQVKAYAKQDQAPFYTFFNQVYETFTGCCTNAFWWMNRSLFKISGVPVTTYDLLLGVFIIAAAFFISFVARQAITRLAKRQNRVSDSSIFIIKRVLHYAIVLVGILIALSAIGLDLNRIFIVLGALSVGIGFGLQTIVNNFVSSLILTFSRNLKVGDYIQLTTGEWGAVTDINVQNTIIRTRDGIDLILPNYQLISNRYDNWTRRDSYIRVHIPFTVPFGSDKDLVSKVVVEASKKVPAAVIDHSYIDNPKVWLAEFGENGLNFELVVWINIYSSGHRGSIFSSFRWEVDTALQEAGLFIPYPQRDIRVYPGDELPKPQNVPPQGPH